MTDGTFGAVYLEKIEQSVYGCACGDYTITDPNDIRLSPRERRALLDG